MKFTKKDNSSQILFRPCGAYIGWGCRSAGRCTSLGYVRPTAFFALIDGLLLQVDALL